MRCSGSTGIGLESFADIKVGVDPSPVDEGSPRFHQIDIESFDTVNCDKEKCDSVKGDNRIKSVKDKLYDQEVSEIEGSYQRGRLNGNGKIIFKSGRTIDGFFKDDILHGFARYFDRKGRLTFIGNHRNGRPVGTCWKIIRGGGCVVGRVDSSGSLTGPRISYIYPDYQTAYVGFFRDGVMQSGQAATVIEEVDDDAGVKVPIFSKPDGHIHKRQIGTFDFICSGIMVNINFFWITPSISMADPIASDPYESRIVYVGQSEIEGAKEGLFALRDIDENTTVAFYNGSRANPQEFDPSTWETNNYKIFDPSDIPHGTIDIPVWAQVTIAFGIKHYML